LSQWYIDGTYHTLESTAQQTKKFKTTEFENKDGVENLNGVTCELLRKERP